MIQILAAKYPKHIAYLFFLLFCAGLLPAYAHRTNSYHFFSGSSAGKGYKAPVRSIKNALSASKTNPAGANQKAHAPAVTSTISAGKPETGGPNQPEMSSFKSVGADNMVNLFTGDFSYNIPLLDVGGYPVNIFYDGSISMEQESSWVGLGWNINPGTVSRNMRGVPDDFNGEDVMTQTQKMKPNTTWGASVGYDLELAGKKETFLENFTGSAGASLGISFNNYLGPALDLGIKGGTNFKMAGNSGSEKTLSVGGGISANISSRNGLTISPNFSLTAGSFRNGEGLSVGLGLSTSYNSRSGIKQLQLSEQMSYNYSRARMTNGTEVGLKDGSQGASLLSSSISFSKPSYIPSLRLPLTNSAWSGHFQLGSALFGVYGSTEVEVYKQKSEILGKDVEQIKPMIGYIYYEKANNNPSAVMDFTRLNDKEVTANTPIISAPQYSYDVFSIQGEGTGGTIRAYRNDLGYVRDNTTRSQDKSISLGADVGVPGHFGANFNTIKTPSTISEWVSGNRLRNIPGFRESDGTTENVYFRNPGENSVLATDQFKKIGGASLVRYKLGGSNANPTLEPVLEKFDNANNLIGTADLLEAAPTERKKRTQVTSFLNADDASRVGLDKYIKSYDADIILDASNTLKYDVISRTGDYRKKHHISQINVTEGDGRRYVYGIPVYNITQKDFSFTVKETGGETDQVSFALPEANSLNNDDGWDGYLQTTTTPPYAHSFLLSGLLSPDYVDVTENGITEDDLGQAVKFNYTRIRGTDGWINHEWRTPRTQDNGLVANFNSGNLTEKRDDKGLITYGIREAWYMHSIESKTMIALFTLEGRKDGKGVTGELGGIKTDDNSQKRLKKIDLYSKSDLKKNGLAGAKPVKTVWFTYTYALCANVPGNNGAADPVGDVNVNSAKGKLTLQSIYFTYNGKVRTNKNNYLFGYTYKDGTGNPGYQAAASDRWGSYKAQAQNPGSLKNSVYPYSSQDKNVADQNAGAWALKTVLLPSGGQLEVSYEGDDYAFVQNRRAAAMMEIAGLGNSPTATSSNKLYTINGLGITDNDYVFIKVPQACTGREEVFERYLKGLGQLAFKMAVNMPKGVEYVPVYTTIADYGYVASASRIWVKLHRVNGLSPLTLAALDYLRERLPGQAFTGYDVSESSGLAQVGDVLLGMLVALKGAFQDPVLYLRGEHKAQTIVLGSSFVRVNNSNGYKYGGGQRVRSVKLKDNWKKMTGQYDSEYGQVYDYQTTEIFNGAERTISSGVASYEPSIGGEENPFQTIVQVQDKLPLGPASYGAIELPVLDAFFSAPVVGYSKVTVKSVQKGTIDPSKKSRSGIGKQVTEFYTAKDFPVYYNHTSLDPASDKQAHQASLLGFFYKYAFDSRALSQGFLVATNDMHGKLKSQSSYAEGDEKTRINYTENFYRNTGVKGFDEKFDFVHASKGGVVEEGNMGIDIELMTDTREFSVKSSSLEIQGQLDLFPVVFPFWLPFIWPVAGNSENTYRAVTTTKVINYHSIVDRVVVIDKGSEVSTKNLVYDAETGSVVVNRTNNEFDKAIYTTAYPAWWAYSGMGLAYKNIDGIFKGVDFLDGKPNNTGLLAASESGDELYILKTGSVLANCNSELASSSEIKKIWAFNKNKNTISLTDPVPDFTFLDAKGKPYNRGNVTVRVIRSGHRNLLGETVAGIVTMTDPIDRSVENNQRLVIRTDAKVVNASSVEYKEKWQTDKEVIRRVKLVSPSIANLVLNGDFSNGLAGINSDYTYSPAQTYGGNDGKYSVAANPRSWNTNGFYECNGHTSGNDNMMLVNGATQQISVWGQSMNVLPNTNYVFSGWAQSVSTQSPANLQFKVNGNAIGSTLQLSSAACSWTNFYLIWNSGSNTNADLSIVDLNIESVGNDFALDDLSFKIDECGNPLMEVDDCTGDLEKSINPYLKGLIGNFIPEKSLVLYVARKNADPSIQTDLKNDGFLQNFSPYWNFNPANDLIPTGTNDKWQWNSRIARINAKGLGLETENALHIFTSVQYGFNKTLPTATTENSRYQEMFFEGFEDLQYKENISNNDLVNNCFPNTVFDATNLVSSDAAGSAAHTGKYVKSLGAGSTLTTSVAVKGAAPANYALLLQTDYKKVLSDGGGNHQITFSQPADVLTNNSSNTYSFSGNHPTVNITLYPKDDLANGNRFHYYTTTFDLYIEISESKVYNFSWGIYTAYNNAGATINTHSNSCSILISDLDGNVVSSISRSQNAFEPTYGYYDVKLCPGIYKIKGYLTELYSATNNGSNYTVNSYSWACTNSSSLVYKSLMDNGCSYSKPITASEEMLNPGFSVPLNKKMLFSAWVREGCANLLNNPCSTTGYTNTEVKLEFSDGTTIPIKPNGPVIEGWQRCEATFTAPAGATQMTMKFINSAGYPLYLDDIRIHPFNANMKSFVYDPINLRLVAQLDANNYATFYEYDEEGTLVRTKAETKEGVKTISETRSFKQAAIKEIQ